MIVSVKISLKEATQAKKQRLQALLRRVRGCTRRYLESLWDEPGKLDAETGDRIEYPSLSARHRNNCLKVALEMVVATKKSAKTLGRPASCPKPPRRMRLGNGVCSIEKGKGAFDYVLKISGLVPREQIVIPFKSHKQLEKWLAVPGAEIRQGATVDETEAILWIKIPDEPPKEVSEGKVLAVDAGVNKLLVDSEGNRYGEDCRDVLANVRRKKPGSKGKARALAARKDYLNRVVKQLPFADASVIAREDLTGIKTGKKKNRGKNFRKLIAPWTIRQVFSRIDFVAKLNRVRVLVVDPRDTSRTCVNCRHCASENRKGEKFKCVACGWRQDADEVGALNILEKALETLGSLWSPSQRKAEATSL